MKRRRFLRGAMYDAFIFVASRLPRHKYGPVFRVRYVDPQGSGMDFSGHLGAYIYNAKRCCLNCETLFGAFRPGGDVENGPQFIHHELKPVNPEASQLLDEILAKTVS